MDAFIQALKVLRQGKLPEGHGSLEDTINHHDFGVSSEDIAQLCKSFKDSQTEFVIVDGFLLYTISEIYDQLDIKLFVRDRYEALKERRDSRPAYTTIEGKNPV